MVESSIICRSHRLNNEECAVVFPLAVRAAEAGRAVVVAEAGRAVVVVVVVFVVVVVV